MVETTSEATRSARGGTGMGVIFREELLNFFGAEFFVTIGDGVSDIEELHAGGFREYRPTIGCTCRGRARQRHPSRYCGR